MKSMMRKFLLGGLLLWPLVLSSCSSTGPSFSGHDIIGISPEEAYRLGKIKNTPYAINGKVYVPMNYEEAFAYEETGTASWYGQETLDQHNGQQTAYGEIFDPSRPSAAHKYLPLPSLVRVTNLDNGRSIVVRVNDRGPFVGSRIIDLSHRSAQLLGYDRVGTAKVRVQILPDESRAVAAAARAGTPPEYSDLGPAPTAAPRGAVQVAGLPPPAAPVSRPPVAPPSSLAGTTEDGRFLPAAVVKQMPVTGSHQIYVQAGAFSQYDNANRVRERVAGFGPASISQIRVGATQFYRVRLGPIESVDKADAILARVVGTGNTNARVIVD